jgi:(2Fe-2S) ferredoxin
MNALLNRTGITGATCTNKAGIGRSVRMMALAGFYFIASSCTAQKNVTPNDMDRMNHDFVQMVTYATKAPSGHNTQPWKFELLAHSINIIPDLSKALPAVDGSNRELFISLGCALENLCIAARHLGYLAHVRRQDAVDITVHLEKSPAVEDDPLFLQIERRQTNRSMYRHEIIPDTAVQQLESVALQEGSGRYLFPVHSPSAGILTEYIMKGNEIQMNDKAFKKELTAWMRFNDGEIRRTNDGLTYRAMGFPSIPRFMGKHIVGSFLKPAKQNDGDRKKISSSSHLVLFTTKDDTASDWIDLGRSLQRFLLKASELNIACAYLNPPCEIESLANELKTKIAINSESPAILLRTGYADPMPYAPRKDVGEVIESAEQDISATLSKEDFRRIVQFVLTEGDRQTYCQMYNNNPHYAAGDFEIYLNPVNQSINFWAEHLSVNVSDYNEIVLHATESGIYYNPITLGDNGKVHIPTHRLEPHKNILRDVYIPKIKSLIADTMPRAQRKDIDISATLNRDDFSRIVQFVLSEGDRVIYSQMYYNDSPHYAADGFEIFLDPAGQYVKYENDLSYYTHITIRTQEPRTYYDFIELFDDGKVYMYTHPLQPHEGFENLLLDVYIPKLKSLVENQ